MDDNKLSSLPEENNKEEESQVDNSLSTTTSLTGLYEDWFLDYASYVILERAVPDIRDGFKPVQRRILHSMKEIDDGRYNKVANIIGHTMKYHPHGDKSIGDALVQVGQRDLLVDTQGNWGNILTGDSAAAPRYIEARLSKFALEVVFNPKTTKWNQSYDGRNKEPENLPVKFPMLLVMGIEGIAVGMASKILPHNFNELLDASIKILQGKSFDLYPDFITGGYADVSKYNDGIRGGKVRVRAKISKFDNKTLVITELPFSTNTSSLIDSIISANDKGKIKIKKIEDNTAEFVEILIHLGANVSPDQTIDALYAFTRCEDSISPNSTVISGEKPVFIGMKEILRTSTDETVALLKLELEIRRAELLEKWHFSSLEKIFIRERLYRNIEEAESFSEAIDIIDVALDPYKKGFKRGITREDIERLTEIRIKRISKYNEFKADEIIQGLEDEIAEVENFLANLIEYAIDYFKRIKAKYGKGRERKTELRNFDNINAAAVAVDNVKLYVNREEGFVGTSLRKDEYITDCSDLDDIIVFLLDGSFQVTKVSDKTFVGKNIIHVGILKRGDDRTIYNMVYRDGKLGYNYVKRFSVTSITRDKAYHLTKGKEDSKVLYFTVNPNGEAEVIKVKLRARPKLKKLNFDFDFSELAIKGRSANGNIITKNIISKITLKEGGVSTLGAREIWYDSTVKRLNTSERGDYLGAFMAEEEILNIMSSGTFRTSGYDLSTHFPEDLSRLLKFDAEQIWTAVYWEGESAFYYIKRFKFISSTNSSSFITEHPKSKLVHLSRSNKPNFEIIFDPKKGPKNKASELIDAIEFIDEKSFKAKGKRLSSYKIKKINMLKPKAEELAEGETKDEVVEIKVKAASTIKIKTEAKETKAKFVVPTKVEAKVEEQIVEKEVEEKKAKVSVYQPAKTEDKAPKKLEKKPVKEVEEKVVEKIEKKPKPKATIKHVEEKLAPKVKVKAPEVVEKSTPKVEKKSIPKKKETPKEAPIKKEEKKPESEDAAKEKSKKKAKAKKETTPKSTPKLTVSLDDEEPLQMELDL